MAKYLIISTSETLEVRNDVKFRVMRTYSSQKESNSTEKLMKIAAKMFQNGLRRRNTRYKKPELVAQHCFVARQQNGVF